MSNDGRSDDFSIFITVDEWRDVVRKLRWTLTRDERDPNGSVLLVCDGEKRTWATMDENACGILRCEGSAVQGPSAMHKVRVQLNSRMFRRESAEDAVLHVHGHPKHRSLTLHTDGLSLTIPEARGSFPSWVAEFEKRQPDDGVQFVVDQKVLVEALTAASVMPLGFEHEGCTGYCYTWVQVVDGRLTLETPWGGFAQSTFDLGEGDRTITTEPVLIEVNQWCAIARGIDEGPVRITVPVDQNCPIVMSTDGYEARMTPADLWGEERASLNRMLNEYIGAEVHPDEDGDLSVVTRSGVRVWFRLDTSGDCANVGIFSVLATGVNPDPQLFAEVNAINAGGSKVHIVWRNDVLVAQTFLPAGDLRQNVFAAGINEVVQIAKRYTGLLTSFFGPSLGDDQEQLEFGV